MAGTALRAPKETLPERWGTAAVGWKSVVRDGTPSADAESWLESEAEFLAVVCCLMAGQAHQTRFALLQLLFRFNPPGSAAGTAPR
jgi:hypothetical protein